MSSVARVGKRLYILLNTDEDHTESLEIRKGILKDTATKEYLRSSN
jgi:hypothetical protein